MRDKARTIDQLLHENAELHQRVAELEMSLAQFKKTKVALRESEERFRAIADYAYDWENWFDVSGTLVWVNRAVFQITGYTADECMAMIDYPLPLVAGEDRERFARHFGQAVQGTSSGDLEFHIRCKDGSRKWVAVAFQPIYDGEGICLGHRSSVRDITDRKRAEDELWESKQKFQGLVETLYDWIWEVDCEGRYTYISPQIKNILGYDPEEILGKTAFDLMSPEDAKRLKEIFSVLVKEERPLVAIENINIHKDGRLVVLETDGLPFYDAAGDLKGYRGTDRDITERKKMEKELKAHQEHLEQLVAKRTTALREEITRREDRENELSVKSKTLEEVNAALRVLLKQREEDRKELEGKFVSNIRQMILPYIHKMQKSRLDPKHAAYLNIVATNLTEIMSPFLNTVKRFDLTPREIEVALLIKDGRSTKEIADLMGVAVSAVHSHRDNIRKKLGLNNKKINLRTRLQLFE